MFSIALYCHLSSLSGPFFAIYFFFLQLLSGWRDNYKTPRKVLLFDVFGKALIIGEAESQNGQKNIV